MSRDYWTGEPEPPMYPCVDDGRVVHEGDDELEACEACIPTDPNANADEARDWRGEWERDVAASGDTDFNTQTHTERHDR